MDNITEKFQGQVTLKFSEEIKGMSTTVLELGVDTKECKEVKQSMGMKIKFKCKDCDKAWTSQHGTTIWTYKLTPDKQ